MKLKQISMIKDYAPSFSLNLGTGVGNDSFILKNADGLGPPMLNAFTEPKIAGGIFLGDTRFEDREVTLTIKLNPNRSTGESYSSLRKRLYGLYGSSTSYFGPSRLTLTFDEQDQYGYISYSVAAQIKSITPSLFDKDTTVQVVIMCLDPVFTKDNTYYFNNTVTLTSNTDGTQSFTIDNPGDVTTGFSLVLRFLADANTFSMNVYNSGGFTATYPFKKDYYIFINSVIPKTVKYGGGGFLDSRTDIFQYVRLSSWPAFRTGSNTVTIPGGTVLDNVGYSTGALTFYPAILGV